MLCHSLIYDFCHNTFLIQMRQYLLALSLFATHVCRSQDSRYQLDQSISVEKSGVQLPYPWAGGINSAQIGTIDLDQDGIEDIVVFDRTANKLFTFLNSGNKCVYSPDYETMFPSSISNWMLLRDFNCDGKKDLFVADISGMVVYVNVSKGGKLLWRSFNNGLPVLTIGFNGPVNLKVNQTDIPAIDDVDGDGDLDVLNTRFVGAGTVEYHQNMSIENSGKCDSLQMVRITQIWGNFEECDCGLIALQGKDCSQATSGRVLHDEGKSLLTLDVNNDGVRDLLFSEEDCTALYSLINTGSNTNADISTFGKFPSANPITLLFPAGYYEDVDFDGAKDLVISSNISSTVFASLDFSNSVLQYKNTGTDLLPQFSFVKSNFLQEHMIDVGSYATPSFADADHDGDLDLFVSNWSGADTISSIHYFENTGTYDQPSFKVVTDDYMQFSKFELYNIKIQFVDVNADGKTDLAFTATSRQTDVTELYFLYNRSSGVFDFSGQSPIAAGVQIDLPENVLLADLDKDGLLDMLIGKVDGSLQYWSNRGSANSFFPVLSNSSFLGLGASISRYCVSTSVADLKQDGKADLLVGNKGSLVTFSDFETTQNQVSDTIYIENARKGVYENRNIGGSIRPVTADLYFNFSPLVFVGTISGGIYVLKPGQVNSSGQALFYWWPNPASPGDNITIRANQLAAVQIFNILGQELGDAFSVQPNETYNLNHNLSNGLYIARVSFQSKSISKKFIIR